MHSQQGQTAERGRRCAPTGTCVVLLLSDRVHQTVRRENRNVETDSMKRMKHSLGSVPRASCLTRSCSTDSFQVCFQDWRDYPLNEVMLLTGESESLSAHACGSAGHIPSRQGTPFQSQYLYILSPAGPPRILHEISTIVPDLPVSGGART